MDLLVITKKIFEIKKVEDELKAKRMALEKEFEKTAGVPAEWEGARTTDIGEFKVVVKRAMNVKIDAAKLDEITKANKLEKTTASCFRFKPEINKKAFNELTPYDQGLYAPAITKTPGKLAVNVEIREEKK